ncbi:MAG TPA: hypothetical protein VFW62_03405, partial [bacterium]|nr:hypothetical protein [bacterium]
KLEESFLEHLKAKPIAGQKKLLDSFAQSKAALENSSDDSLYVSPKFLTQMADAYLYRHKGLSRRRLALSLSQTLEKRGISIGLETLQAALSNKTQKVRKVLEEELLDYFRAEGFAGRAEVEAYLNETEAAGRGEVRKVEVGDLSQWADAYLLKHPGLSRRQLALQVRDRLEKKGYVYHLSSIQSVLEGKTRKTRQVIVETLKELLESEGLDTDAAVEPADASRLDWSHYVSAEGVPAQVQALLDLYAGLTRRQVALKLQEDLQAKGFHFSLSTLQYLLAGKTQRVKKVVIDLLETYAQPGGFPEPVKSGRSHGVNGSRQALQKRVEESLERYRMAEGAEREARHELFHEIRWELIRRVALKRQAPVLTSGRRRKDLLGEGENTEGFYEGNADSGEISVAYDVRESLDRLVS